MRWPLLASIALTFASPSSAQAPDTVARLAAQREAMAALSMLDGTWRGEAWAMTPAGRREFVQAERVGPFLGGSVRLVEGRGYEADGDLVFNAFGIISYDPDRQSYSMHSYAMGHSGTYPLRPTGTGFQWELPAGPGAIVRYTAVVQGGTWHEIGERIVGDGPPQRMFEMRLQRVGDTDWPGAGAVPMR